MLSILLTLVAVGQVWAIPAPQGVTADITPTSSAPAGCSPTYSGTFGIAVMNVTSSADPPAGASSSVVPSAASQSPDGQPQANSGSGTVSVAPVTQISDHQIQASTAQPVSQIGDGQPQAGGVVSQIGDGQIQAPSTQTMMAVTQIHDGQIQAPTSTVVAATERTDGQPNVATSTAVAATEKTDGQPNVATSSAVAATEKTDGQPVVATSTEAPVSEKSEGQPVVTSTSATVVSEKSEGQPVASTASPVSEKSEGQPVASTSTGSAASSSASVMMVACSGNSTLSLTLSGGVLKDASARTGYIASNYQFQFDDPPQAGAIYTAGFSVCGNGSLALGGSSIFYQCLSGDFYNLYDRHWAAQCNPVTINVVKLITCT